MDEFKLLSRDNFRELVFKRDNYKCIICDEVNNLDAHHIIERRLFNIEYCLEPMNGTVILLIMEQHYVLNII